MSDITDVMRRMAEEKKKEQARAEQQRIVNEEMFASIDSNDYSSRVDLCLQKGADINARNGEGQTVLMRAVWKESEYRVRYVLSKNPDLFAKDSRGRTAFDLNKETRDAASRQKITEHLLKAMPDSRANPALSTATAPAPDAPQDKGDRGIAVSRPLTLKGTKKGGQNPGGGFRL